jgi:hypothetical protein
VDCRRRRAGTSPTSKASCRGAPASSRKPTGGSRRRWSSV